MGSEMCIRDRYATTGLIGLFLLLPIVFIVLLSFGSSQWLVFPPPGWTLKWYGQFFSNPDWMNAAAASLKVAVLTTICAVALGLPTAFALVRGRFPGREMLYGLFTLPMIVPLVIIAVAVYALFLSSATPGPCSRSWSATSSSRCRSPSSRSSTR